MTGRAPRVAVVGSINVDAVTRGDRLPAAGETRKGSGFALALGGKGANQAIAAHKLGADVAFIAQTGDDAFGAWACAEIANFGLDLGLVGRRKAASTGVATIFVDSIGQNAITIIGGANDLLDADALAKAAPALESCRCLLLQCETPAATNLAAARVVKAAGGLVILDPAPALAEGIASELLRFVDFITPNETESLSLTGIAVRDSDSARSAAEVLLSRGVAGVVIKMGANGAFFAKSGHFGLIPAFSVAAIDTVAAGDSFNAGLGVALAEGIVLPSALRFASACGALATTRSGAAAAAPLRAEVEARLAAG